MTFEGRLGRSAGLAGAFGGIVFALLVSAGTSRSAHLVQKDGAYPKPAEEIKLVGEATCQQCHNEANPEKVNILKQTHGYKFVRMWENTIWNTHDLHSQAYKNLASDKNDLARKMEANLKKLKGEAYKTLEDVNCLACHASTVKPVSAVKPKDWNVKSFDKLDGVGCEMCHGHGGAYSDKHSKTARAEDPGPDDPVLTVPWRTWPAAVKSDWGLVNLRDPVTATAKCASCHVGNKDEGRFVTHEMYAAGHPPLPPLDLMAYSREQPRHWGLPSQMPYLVNLAKNDPKKAFEIFHYRSEETESSVTRRFVESTIAALRSTAALTLQLADEAKPKNDGLDFAAFDCYSCHHDLKYPSDRQARGYDGPPGRPQFRIAPFALASTVVGDEELGKKLDAARRELAFAFNNRSYGDPEAIAKAASGVNAWCDDAMKKVRGETYDAAKRKELLDRIVRDAARESPRPVADPELAQLYLWAVATISLDIEKDGKLPANVEKLRESLGSSVVTRLRPGLPFDFEVKAADPIKDSQKPVSERIKTRMEIFNAFKGELFRGAFKK